MANEKNKTPPIVKKVDERNTTKTAWINKGKGVIMFLPNVIINTFAVLALWFMTVLLFDFDPNYLLTWEALITSVVLMLIFVMSHWSMYDMRVKKLRSDEKNIEWEEEQEDKIKKVTNSISWAEHNQEFINYRNYNEKVDAWKKHVTNELKKLENKAKEKDLEIEDLRVTDFQRENMNEEQIEMLEIEIEQQKETNKYLQRKASLEAMLNDEWIAENLHKKNIEYNKIDKLFVESGVELEGQRKDKQSGKGKYAKDNAMQRVYMLGLSIFLSAFGVQLAMESFSKEALFIFFFRIVILTFNIVMGLNYGDRYYKEVDVHNIKSRKSITDEFKTWALNKGYAKT